MRRLHAAAFIVALGCSESPPASMIVFVEAAEEPAISAFVEELDVENVVVRVVDDPAAAFTEEAVPQVAIVADLDCEECFRIERAEGAVVHGDAPLGVQYGLAALLEAMGFRFYHPHRSLVPETLALPEEGHEVYGVEHEPELTFRGLQIHTLHPIEGYFAFWEPSPEHLAEARAIIDWIVKNRGDHVQWWGLENVVTTPGDAEELRAHMREIIEYAHMRGVDVGLGVQLFSRGNLQRAYTLDGDAADPGPAIRQNLAPIEGLGFDQIKIAFGEFAAQDADRFITTLNEAASAVRELSPETEVTASVHVGDDLRVTYMGREQLYYFLVRYADPTIVPWIHTVMYYNLYDEVGGAYHHVDFSEHREFMLERLAAGERAVYYPENAYWVAFDNSVPTYLPVYMRSRWVDQSRLQEDSGGLLREHATFTSGWEWGYWQYDYYILRANYSLPTEWAGEVRTMFAPYGARGETIADAIEALGELQHQHLIVGHLDPYIAGRDALLDLARGMDIISQPDRPSFEEIVAMDEPTLSAFEADIVEPLAALAGATETILAEVEPVVEDDRWLGEVRDGIAVDLHRARFAHAIWSAIVAHARGMPTGSAIADARAALEEARAVVARRHADLHDPEPERVIAPRLANETLYQYGYLREADRLCFWERELVLLTNLIDGADETIPGCVL